jgi:hypothetical protein
MDCHGRVFDFHAFRTTCGTWLDKAGVSASLASKITGHANITTLTTHYHRFDDDAVRGAVDMLPELSLQATGTDGPGRPTQQQQQLGRFGKESIAAGRRVSSDRTESSRDHKHGSQGEIEKAPQQVTGPSSNEGDGNRTRNLWIDSPVL